MLTAIAHHTMRLRIAHRSMLVVPSALRAYAHYCGEKAERRDRGALSVRGAISNNFANL